jgi:hypothetical protein
MKYQFYYRRKPIKRVQLQPAHLSSKYQESLQPSFMLIWCWKILVAAENASLALATWWRGKLQIGRQLISDPSQRMAIQAQARHYREELKGWFSWAFMSAWHGLVTLGQAILSRLRSSRVVARRSSWNPSASRFQMYPTDRQSLRLSSPRERDLSQELAEGRARLVEELLVDEEELTRVATRVVRLQCLILAQEQLLTEMAHADEDPAQSSQFPAVTADSLVRIGTSSSRGKVRDISFLGGTKRFPHSHEPQKSGA